MTPRHLSVVLSGDSSQAVSALDGAVERLRQTKRAQVHQSYRALRKTADPRGHDLLDAIEAHHLELVDLLFNGMKRGGE